jgi:hypothetical protein
MSAIADSFIETAVLDLDALRRMSYAELDSLYRGARCPRVISELNADTRGAMLAWRSPRTGPIAWWLRTFGASQSFPWEALAWRLSGSEKGPLYLAGLVYSDEVGAFADFD